MNKKPAFNEFERWAILNSDSLYSASLKLRLEILKLKRELWKIIAKTEAR